MPSLAEIELALNSMLPADTARFSPPPGLNIPPALEAQLRMQQGMMPYRPNAPIDPRPRPVPNPLPRIDLPGFDPNGVISQPGDVEELEAMGLDASAENISRLQLQRRLQQQQANRGPGIAGPADRQAALDHMLRMNRGQVHPESEIMAAMAQNPYAADSWLPMSNQHTPEQIDAMPLPPRIKSIIDILGRQDFSMNAPSMNQASGYNPTGPAQPAPPARVEMPYWDSPGGMMNDMPPTGYFNWSGDPAMKNEILAWMNRNQMRGTTNQSLGIQANPTKKYEPTLDPKVAEQRNTAFRDRLAQDEAFRQGNVRNRAMQLEQSKTNMRSGLPPQLAGLLAILNGQQGGGDMRQMILADALLGRGAGLKMRELNDQRAVSDETLKLKNREIDAKNPQAGKAPAEAAKPKLTPEAQARRDEIDKRAALRRGDTLPTIEHGINSAINSSIEAAPGLLDGLLEYFRNIGRSY